MATVTIAQDTTALQTVIQAAEKWRDELSTEIIPAAHPLDAEDYQAELEGIEQALTQLQSTTRPR